MQTDNIFIEYFENGLSPSEARSLHESKLLLQDTSCMLLANSSINPTMRHVYYLHDEWRKINFGPVHAPLSKLEEKIGLYNKKGKCNVMYTIVYQYLIYLNTCILKFYNFGFLLCY